MLKEEIKYYKEDLPDSFNIEYIGNDYTVIGSAKYLDGELTDKSDESYSLDDEMVQVQVVFDIGNTYMRVWRKADEQLEN